jgi:hypothetical protein
MSHRDIFKAIATVAALGALAVPTAQAQDLRSPDAQDAAAAHAVDLRSPDARDAAVAPDKSAVAKLGDTASGSLNAIGQQANPTASDSNGFDWGSAGIGAAVALAALALAGGAALMVRHRPHGSGGGANIAH